MSWAKVDVDYLPYRRVVRPTIKGSVTPIREQPDEARGRFEPSVDVTPYMRAVMEASDLPCRMDPYPWSAALDKGGQSRAVTAKRLCQGCVVQYECAMLGFLLPEVKGVWGGYSAEELKKYGMPRRSAFPQHQKPPPTVEEVTLTVFSSKRWETVLSCSGCHREWPAEGRNRCRCEYLWQQTSEFQATRSARPRRWRALRRLRT